MVLNILLLLVGFALLIKGADFLVLGSSALARKYNVSELVIGLTIVSFGTSAPEMVVNLVSSFKGYNDVAFGNIIGSNIFNLFFILGITAMIYPISLQRSTIIKEIPYSIIAAVVLLLLANDHLYSEERVNQVNFPDALILLVFFLLFLFYVFKNMKNDNPDIAVEHKEYSMLKILLLIIGGLAGLVFGGNLSVNNGVEIARAAGMSERVIGLTIMAIGTSLPEVATSAVAAYRRNSDIAIGNVVGSNIFNILFILGISGLVNPLPYQLGFNTDITVLIGGTFLLLFFTYTGKKAVLERWEGIILFTFYIGYTLFLIFQ